MKNLNNFGLIEGRLTKDPIVFENSDGSRKVLLNVAVRDPYPDRYGNYNSQFVDLQAFVCAGCVAEHGLGPFDHIHKGDLACFGYSVRTNRFERDGRTVFDQVLLVDQVTFKGAAKSASKGSDKAESAEADSAEFREPEDKVPFPDPPSDRSTETVNNGYDRKEW